MDFPVEDLYVAAAWTSPFDRRYTIMQHLPAGYELEPLGQWSGNNWNLLAQQVEAQLRETVRLRPGILGSKSQIFFTADSVQIVPFHKRENTTPKLMDIVDRQVLDALSAAYRLPERLFGHSYKLRFVLLSDTPVPADAIPAPR